MTVKLRRRQFDLGDLGAFLQHFEIVRDRFPANDIGMGLAGAAGLDQAALGIGIVEFGMIGHHRGGVLGRRDFGHVALRLDISIQALRVFAVEVLAWFLSTAAAFHDESINDG